MQVPLRTVLLSLALFASIVASQSCGGGVCDTIFQLTNAYRAQAGVAALACNGALVNAAQAHSDDMVSRNYFSHTGSDGSSPFDRMHAWGYQYTWAGENIAAGNSQPDATMNQWMNSPGHRANILNGNFRDFGCGFSMGGTYGYYWTQTFGSTVYRRSVASDSSILIDEAVSAVREN